MAQFRPGLELVHENQCPLHARASLACYQCIFGHPDACHYPMECAEAGCQEEEKRAHKAEGS